MIRKIENVDIPECVGVIKESFLTVAKDFGITQKNAPSYVAFATTEEKLLHQLNEEGRHMFAYFNEYNKMIGCYSLRIQEDCECELNNLCVLSDYRSKGIGKKLLEHAFAQAKTLGCIKMNIGIVEENTRLKHWYETFGFKHLGTQKYDCFPFTCGYMTKTFI